MDTFDIKLDAEQIAVIRAALDLVSRGTDAADLDAMFRDVELNVLNDFTA